LTVVSFQLILDSQLSTFTFQFDKIFTLKSSIQNKSRDFAIRIINCYNFLLETRHEHIMSKQLLRCGTSIGANTRESKNAQSRMDFLSKLNIALKEADETEYWLDLLHETGYLDESQFHSLQSDCKELIAILVSIIKTLKETPEKKK
jgi:four helix bundle protein